MGKNTRNRFRFALCAAMLTGARVRTVAGEAYVEEVTNG